MNMNQTEEAELIMLLNALNSAGSIRLLSLYHSNSLIQV